jgi:D-arginine dehydrogenase
MISSDILVIGGGVAGLSAAAALSGHATVAVLEAEDAVGVHSSGRSATMLHYALGDPLVRALTLAGRGFFDSPPDGFSDAPLGKRMPVLVHARQSELPALDALEEAMAPFASLERLDEAGLLALCPVLRTGGDQAVAGLADRDGLRLDPHALLQGYARQLRRSGGQLATGARAVSIRRQAGLWEVETERSGRFTAPILVNAAGAWADSVAQIAAVRLVGLQPLRRTIITFDAPGGVDAADWPFAKTVGDELYFAPESGRLFASPMDEVATDPSDAQPDEYEVALAAHRVEERTTMKVRRVHSRWAGLRTFAPDRHPVAGFAPDAPGFFWLAGQGGFGLQTAPAMASIVASIVAGTAWPLEAVTADALSPARFFG